MVRPIDYAEGKIVIIDQRRLPSEKVITEIKDHRQMIDAIKTLAVRGAPALGIAGAFGCYLASKEIVDIEELRKAMKDIAAARPTAVNLAWAVERFYTLLEKDHRTDAFLKEALFIQRDDIKRCENIGLNGRDLIPEGANVLTHCNAGSLATGDHGTALSPIFFSHSDGKKLHVWVDETRPLLQGARLTSWELSEKGIPNTVICDNMAGSLMAAGKVDLVIIGADRIAANGDAANKIGSYPLSVLAKYHHIPFYVAAPLSTFDDKCPSGADIKIEIRREEEIRYSGNRQMVPENANVYNPAFDIVPVENITAFITEEGIRDGGEEMEKE
ncbi:S-methyl-5-thioribose-1-phosphate isomerase [bacterium]|nr:S-methyl-5-thioribose-1-phosphate isomerase [bacterium]